MKKLISLLLCLLLLTATLTACGEDSESKSKEDKKQNSDAVVVESKDSHENGSTTEHAANDGHNHGSAAVSSKPADDTTTITSHTHTHATESTEEMRYQVYTNADNTYRVVFRDTKGKTVAEFDKLPRQPSKEVIDEANGIYELGWATDSGPNDYYCVYYNIKNGQISQQFHAPRGCDGTRVAYGSEDQTKVIVQDVFDKEGYYKEYELKNATEKNGNIIVTGRLHENKKTVIIAYHSTESEDTVHITVELYE